MYFHDESKRISDVTQIKDKLCRNNHCSQTISNVV